MKKFILTILILSVCSSAYALPLWSEAIKISYTDYDKVTNNCEHKARAYFNILCFNGYKCNLIVGWRQNGDNEQHSWVEYKENDIWYMVDLTENRFSMKGRRCDRVYEKGKYIVRTRLNQDGEYEDT